MGVLRNLWDRYTTTNPEYNAGEQWEHSMDVWREAFAQPTTTEKKPKAQPPKETTPEPEQRSSEKTGPKPTTLEQLRALLEAKLNAAGNRIADATSEKEKDDAREAAYWLTEAYEATSLEAMQFILKRAVGVWLESDGKIGHVFTQSYEGDRKKALDAVIRLHPTFSDHQIALGTSYLEGGNDEALDNLIMDIHKSRRESPPPDVTENKTTTQKETTPEPQPIPEEPKPPPDGVYLGIPLHDTAPLFLPSKTRERHLYIIGKSGTGKTTLIKNIILQDIANNHGVCFIDPHGDAAEELLGTIPQERIDDVIYLDPTQAYAPAFNPLLLPTDPQKLTEDILAIFRMLYGSSWGFKMEHFLRNALYTLITDKEPHTLHDLRRIFISPDYRDTITNRIADEQTREFWTLDYDGNKQTVGAILNKLSAFLAAGSPLSRLLGHKENRLPLKALMDTKKILIVNLAKGKLGEEPSRLLGALIVAGIQQAALERADTPEQDRVPFYLVVDEFQNYTIESFHSILAEARKYRLYLTLANQTLGQLPSDLQRSIFGNVATLVAFQVSADDGGTLKKEMHRSRFTFRRKGENEYHPAQEAVDEIIELQRSANASVRKRQKDLRAFLQQKDLQDAYFQEVFQSRRKKVGAYSAKKSAKFHLESRLEHCQVELPNLDKILDGPRVPVAPLTTQSFIPPRLKEFFPDYEFKETAFPDTDDFINLPPFHAFSRIERAENVTAFKTNPAPPPTAGTKGKILHLMRAQHEQQQEAIKKPQPAPERPPATHLATEEERAEQTPPDDDLNTSTTPPKRRTPKPKKPKRAPINF